MDYNSCVFRLRLNGINLICCQLGWRKFYSKKDDRKLVVAMQGGVGALQTFAVGIAEVSPELNTQLEVWPRKVT